MTDGAASLIISWPGPSWSSTGFGSWCSVGGATTRRPTTRSVVSTSTTRWSTGCWNRIPPRIQAADWDAASASGVEAQADVDEAAGEVLRLRRLTGTPG